MYISFLVVQQTAAGNCHGDTARVSPWRDDTFSRPCGSSLNDAAVSFVVDVLKSRCFRKVLCTPRTLNVEAMTLNTQEYHQKVWKQEESWGQQALVYMIKAVREEGNVISLIWNDLDHAIG